MAVDFSFHYSASEDRIAVAAKEGDGGASVVLWLTRSLVGRLLGALGQLIPSNSRLAPKAPTGREAVVAFERDNALIKAMGSTDPPLVKSNLPTDREPKLVQQIDLRPLENNQVRISFTAPGAHLNIILPYEGLHVTYAQIEGLVAHAKWNLDVVAPWKATSASGALAPSGTVN